MVPSRPMPIAALPIELLEVVLLTVCEKQAAHRGARRAQAAADAALRLAH